MEHLRNIQKMGTAVRVISIICLVFLGIAIAVLLSATIAFFAASLTVPAQYQTLDVAYDFSLSLEHPLFEQLETKPFDYGTYAAQLQGSQIRIDLSSGEPFSYSLSNLWALFVTPLLQTAAWFVFFCFISRFAKALKQSHSPFTAQIITRLKAIGWSLLAAVTLPSIIGGFVFSYATSGMFKLGITIDLSLVLFVLIFLLLIYIFSYGAKLQEESDTTL